MRLASTIMQPRRLVMRTPSIVEALVRKAFRVSGINSVGYCQDPQDSQLTYRFRTALTTACENGETCAVDEDMAEMDLFNTLETFIAFLNYALKFTLYNFIKELREGTCGCL